MPPCDKVSLGNLCGAPGYRSVGIESLCTTHYSAFLLSLDPSVFGMVGVGVQTGLLCPEWGPGYAELTCVACHASWVGPIGEQCGWCAESLERMNEFQRRRVIRPPEMELTDIRRPARLDAWKERLKKARDAGIITTEEAKAVFGRELRRTE